MARKTHKIKNQKWNEEQVLSFFAFLPRRTRSRRDVRRKRFFAWRGHRPHAQHSLPLKKKEKEGPPNISFYFASTKKYLINTIYFALPLCRWRQSLEEHGGNPRSTWKRGEKDKSKVLVTHSQVGTHNRDRGKSAVHGGSDQSKVRLSLFLHACLLHALQTSQYPFLLFYSNNLWYQCQKQVTWVVFFFHPLLFFFLCPACLHSQTPRVC